MQVWQKVKRSLALSHSSKTVHMNGLDFLQNQKPNFQIIFGTSWALLTQWDFFFENRTSLLFLPYECLASGKYQKKPTSQF